MSKQLINSPEDCVDQCISGLVAVHRSLIQVPGYRIVLRKDVHDIEGKVAIISGGGSGHEPLSAGCVGKGMLTGAALGAVFASPPASTILAAIKSVNLFQPQGVILIVTNYTGDRVNFGLAREWAMHEGIRVEMVTVDEDCALTSTDRSAGRRGLAGTVLVQKIAGALSEKGESLERIVETLNAVVANMGTIGICLEPCTLPGSKAPGFTVKENEIELGLGVHGEAGVAKLGVQKSSDLVKSMLDYMTDQKSASHISLKKQDEVVVLMNNLGGISNLEMGIVSNDVINDLSGRGIVVRKVFCGSFMTSLQMRGVSVSILKVNSKDFEHISLVDLLEMKADAPIPLVSMSCCDDIKINLEKFKDIGCLPMTKTKPEIEKSEAALLKKCIESACENLSSLTETLNEYDSGAGDADCGSTHGRGAEKILALIDEIDFRFPSSVFQKIGLICSEEMGGTSGAMYSILFAGIARKISGSESLTVKTFAEALKEGITSMQKYGGAKVGDRTMLDVLFPVSEELFLFANKNLEEICNRLRSVSEKACHNTIKMVAKAGRASYVSQDRLVNPDPGAVAINQIISSCANVMQKASSQSQRN